MKLACKNNITTNLPGKDATVLATQVSLLDPFRLRMPVAAGTLLFAFALHILTRRRLNRLSPSAGRTAAKQFSPFLLFSKLHKLHPAVLIRRQFTTAALSGPLAHDW